MLASWYVGCKKQQEVNLVIVDLNLDIFSSIKDRKQVILVKFNWQKVGSWLFNLPA